MNSFFYFRLAWNNIRKNSQTYEPYILACAVATMMFYNMCYLMAAKDIGSLSANSGLRSILMLGTVIIGIFSIIFLFYTNSFLIKRRKKEFGLYNILGMDKKHISAIMFFEMLIVGFISVGAGILGGILLSKLIILFLFKIIAFDIIPEFEVPPAAVIVTFLLFIGILMLNLLYNIGQVHLSNPVELLTGGSVGEKEPKANWFLTLTGVLCVGCGYWIALTTESPLAAIKEFFLAVLLVIVGTYFLFIAGSIVILKLLRRNKKYYYRPNHFVWVSGMIYRMKQNAAGLASICVLSTMVIVMVSTTVSMYSGMESLLRNRYPRNIAVSALHVSDEQAKRIDSAIQARTDGMGIVPENVVNYRMMEFTGVQNGSSFEVHDDVSYASANIANIVFVSLEDYNRNENSSETLSDGQALVYTLRGGIPGDTLNINGSKFSIKKRLSSIDADGLMSGLIANCYYIVLKDAGTLKQVSAAVLGNYEPQAGKLSYYYGFDVNEGKDAQIELVKVLKQSLKKIGLGHVEGAESSRSDFYAVYGGLFFIGMFLGLLFVMATVLIIYYKQVTEGFDDRQRFQIMQNVGMSREEVKRSIHSQVLSVFYLPLVMACIHICFAFKYITKLLSLLNLTNVPLFAICTVMTIMVFVIFYVSVYALTARTYYRIVS